MAKRKVQKSQPGSGSDLPGSTTGISSPLIDDFDEELCMELEEVGKELDRYKKESLGVSDSDEGECPFVMQRVPSSPTLQCLPQGESQATQHTSMSAVVPRRGEGEAVSAEVCEAAPISNVSPEVKEGNEEENECQLKALNSLKASLVTKLKMMVTHKANLALQKDSLLKNFDGDKAKLSESLQKHLSHCKEVDVQIQGLNAQITVTRKKIIGLKSKRYLSEIKEQKNGSVDSSVHEKLLLDIQSKVVKDSPVMTDEVCESCDSSSIKETLRTMVEEEEKERVATENSSESQNGYHTDARPATEDPKPHLPHSESCTTAESHLEPAKAQEAKNSDCLVMEKVASTLAMHSSSKNVNTLWCNTCNLFLTSITGYIRHLELPEHLSKEQEDEHFLLKLLGRPKKTHKKVRSNTQEALGVEFLQSTKLIYCSLCECSLVTTEEATSHSQSLQHTNKYKEYILKNTSKELAFQKAKMEAFTEYCKRRKATEKDQKQKPEGKDEDSHRKAILKVDENKTKMEAGLRKTELLKVKTSSEKEAWSQSENYSCGLQGKAKEGRKLIKESPLMPQRTNVNIKTKKSVVGESIKRGLESPAMNKRQKIIN